MNAIDTALTRNSVIWIKFHGVDRWSPMWWAVDFDRETRRYPVIESYDEGQTWVVNHFADTRQAGYDFISDWFAQFYFTADEIIEELLEDGA